MKKTLTLLLLCVSTLMFAQENTAMNQWSIGLNVGGADGHAPIRMGRPKVYQPNFVQGNVRYMFNNRFGVMGTLQYNNFKIGETGYRTNYMNAMIHGVVNAGDIIKLHSITNNKLGLLIHGGFGIGSMWQKGYWDSLGIENPETPLFNRSDDMLVWSFGATPQFKVSEKLSINADLTFLFHGRQHRTFDFQHANNRKGGINGYFLTLSVGATYYIGARSRHADWVPTVYGGAEVDMSSYDARVAQLEKELREAKEAAKKAPDADGDGVPDAYDLCPDKEGPWGFSGCPDTDGDGIPDHLDECPDVYGSWKYKGCPEITSEVKEVLQKALRGVNFETGRAVLTKSSFPALDAVVKVMKEEPTYTLKITGHTDNVGTVEHNMKLSKDRAQAVEDYLEAQGLDASRFIVIGFGPTRPIASNDTPEGKAKNRRVEFAIVF
jgi:OmpA-OmpF porin, OOP family